MSDATAAPRIIPGEQSADARRWEAPVVTGSQPSQTRKPRLTTAGRIDDIEKVAREEGFKNGYADGLKAGQQEIRNRATRLEKLFDSMALPLAGLDQRVEEELVTLATTVARQLLRRELKADPGQVVAVVREALAALPSSEGKLSIHLHPDDAGFVRDALHLAEMERPWRIAEDPAITKGGARITTHASQVDATLETRLNAVIASVWGGDREEDASKEAKGV